MTAKKPVRPDYSDDPAAFEIATIRDWAEALESMASEWLDQREAYRQAQAEQTEAREHRAATELSRGTTP